MKKLILSAVLAVSAISSQAMAGSLTCHTNVKSNMRAPLTDITITDRNGKTYVSETTYGGMAQFVTAPVTFEVEVGHVGPEVVTYTNKDRGFYLEIVDQPVLGQVNGTLTDDVDGQRFEFPVVCPMPLQMNQ